MYKQHEHHHNIFKGRNIDTTYECLIHFLSRCMVFLLVNRNKYVLAPGNGIALSPDEEPAKTQIRHN